VVFQCGSESVQGFYRFGYIICIYIGNPIIKRALNPINRFYSTISVVPVQNRDLDFQGLSKCCVCEGERCSFFLFYISFNGDRRCLSYLFINLSKIVWQYYNKGRMGLRKNHKKTNITWNWSISNKYKGNFILIYERYS
jgi:hypothetical protein